MNHHRMSDHVREPTNRRRAFAGAVALLLLVAAPARADESLPSPSTPEARAHLEEGNKLYLLREYEKAVAAYKEGVKAEPRASYTFWYNLGQAHRQWGKYEDAIWFYQQFLKASPPTLKLHRQAAEDFITKMRGELEKAASTATPTETGPTPIPDRGEPPSTAPVDIAKPLPAPAERRTPRWYEDRLAWGLTGVGVIAVGTGTGFLISGASLEEQANGEPLSSERLRLRDASASRVTIGLVVGGAGLAILGAGVVKLALTPGPSRDAESLRVTVGPSSIALMGRF
jgi:hypothetical protein